MGTPALILEAIKVERCRRECEASLLTFVERAWPVIEPKVRFLRNWHLEAVADHLQAVSRGEIETLLVNVPPGTMKSIMISVCFPAWEWTTRPDLRYLGASYSPDLAIRDSMLCHDIITSEWYQKRWPNVRIERGEDQKIKYALTGGGWRIATSVGGRGTGEHPDRKIVDDPHNAKQADSDAMREEALVWYDRTLSTRGQSRNASTVVVMQRLHERDLAGHILERNANVVHLCIPMEFDEVRKPTRLGWVDPRKVKGELLWPELFPTDKVEALKLVLGKYGAAGQLQQRPSPEGGGRLKPSDFGLWPHDVPLPQMQYLLQSYDTAFTDKTENDPTACTVWGVFTFENRQNVMLLDAWSEHLEYPELRDRALRDWGLKYAGDPKSLSNRKKGVDLVLIEQKGSGQSLLQDLTRAKLYVAAYNPGLSDKTARAAVIAPILDAGLVWVPESKRGGTWATWADDFMRQVERFPKDEHDDYVDTMTQALRYLRDSNFITLVDAKREAEERDVPPPKPRSNPYAA